jgi:hypothetical protein
VFYSNLALVDQTLHGEALQIHLDLIPFAKKGASPYFLDKELALKFTEACSSNTMGDGRSQALVAGECAQFLHSEAAQLREDDLRKGHWSTATCNPKWMSRTEALLRESGLCDVNQKSVKVQKISHKQAAVCQAWLTDAMFDAIEQMYAEHHAAGILKERHQLP